MFETPEQREKREKAEAASREANRRRYGQSMKVELPYSPISTVERLPDVNSDGVTTLPEKREQVVQTVRTVTLQPDRKLRNKKIDKNPLRNNNESRAKYMAEYRKKFVLCPHCGKTFKEIKRVKEEVK